MKDNLIVLVFLLCISFFSCRSNQLTFLEKSVEVHMIGAKPPFRLIHYKFLAHYKFVIKATANSDKLSFDSLKFNGTIIVPEIYSIADQEISRFNKNDSIVIRATVKSELLKGNAVQDQMLTLYYRKNSKNKEIVIRDIQLNQTPIQP